MNLSLTGEEPESEEGSRKVARSSGRDAQLSYARGRVLASLSSEAEDLVSAYSSRSFFSFQVRVFSNISAIFDFIQQIGSKFDSCFHSRIMESTYITMLFFCHLDRSSHS